MAAERDGFSVDATGIGSGTRLGPYQIEGLLGAGAWDMSSARDTRLGRGSTITEDLKSGGLDYPTRSLSDPGGP